MAGFSNSLGALDNSRTVPTAPKALGALSGTTTVTNSPKALGAPSDTTTVTNSPKALGALAVAARHIGATRAPIVVEQTTELHASPPRPFSPPGLPVA
jgi:hypothetical protein